ncbi:ABC transporter permease [Erysipelothrix sp. HDW6C]|uniref:ABC transporter permease n=1 Tax=Erysipelothrix sp. HDW6C TaxID=2714930 RepID=UPI00140AA394|nr:ABC transporter permease [Erysipelothrix sp. HDW6C]QIK69620.1 ABC transporter permease [Erysipelothrix sp. HDW6C]
MFKYRFKTIIKDKALIFWTLIFPMILASLFNVVLRDALTVEKTTRYPVAIVSIDNAPANDFLTILSDEVGLIEIHTFENSADAQASLENDETMAFIEFDGSFKVSIKKATTMTTVLNNALNNFNSKQAMIQTIAQTNPERLTPEFIASLTEAHQFTTNSAENGSDAIFTIHMYTTIAMLCIYASQWGTKSGEYLQADVSALGIRTNVAPTPKLRLLGLDIAVVYLIFMIEFIIHFLFLKFALNVPMGDNYGIIAATALAGGLFSICFGYAASVFIKGGSAQRANFISGFGVLCGFLSGMMSTSVRTAIDNVSPVISMLNPSALISDNFHLATLTGKNAQAFTNIGILLGMALILAILTYRKLKVVSYDSI